MRLSDYFTAVTLNNGWLREQVVTLDKTVISHASCHGDSDDHVLD